MYSVWMLSALGEPPIPGGTAATGGGRGRRAQHGEGDGAASACGGDGSSTEHGRQVYGRSAEGGEDRGHARGLGAARGRRARLTHP